MVLSTMFAFKGDLERQRQFCRRVMMAGAAALFVKTTRFVENMPADVIALADKQGSPSSKCLRGCVGRVSCRMSPKSSSMARPSLDRPIASTGISWGW